jgi:hydrogenase-4 component B
MTAGPFLLVAGLGLIAGLGAAGWAPRVWRAATVLAASAGLAAAALVLWGGAAWEWRSGLAPGGEPIHLRCDALSAFFLALLALVGGAGAVYQHAYWPDRAHPRSARAGRFWWSGLLGCTGLVLLASNGLHFLLAWELFVVCCFGLIVMDARRPDVRAAGWLYLAASHTSSLCLFAFFAKLAAHTGTWDLGPLRDRPDLAPLFWLALIGFGVKAGLFPLHVWLPSAHASAPSHVSAMLSGVTLKLGIYGLVRFTGWLPTPACAGWVVAGLGVASAVLGVAFALGQHDLKRLLAYHSVENIGIILIGLGFALIAARTGHPVWGFLALSGALLHVWNHGIFKALLFFGAGAVVHATGTRELSRLGGLGLRMPWTAGLFAVGAVAICGLPPLNGLVSEWLVYLGLFGAAGSPAGVAIGAAAAAILLALTGAMALACFTKVCGVVFLGAPRSAAAAAAHECAPGMRGSMGVLAGACIVIGLGPALCWPALVRAAAAWDPAWIAAAARPRLGALGAGQCVLVAAAVAGGALLWRKVRQPGARRALTWDCAYAQPTARIQYTAGSFASTITSWFDWILRPVVRESRPEGPFPPSASAHSHTPEVVLEDVVEPAAAFAQRLANAARRLQHGRVQFYLLYLLVGLAGVALVVLGGAH